MKSLAGQFEIKKGSRQTGFMKERESPFYQNNVFLKNVVRIDGKFKQGIGSLVTEIMIF